MSRFISNLPNYLTYLRVLLIPIFVFLMTDPTKLMVFAATLVFVFASITDYLDGMIARRYGVVSNLGKLLDPMADKILVMTALVMLVAQRSDIDGLPWVPAWMVVLILAREIWVTGIRAVAASNGIIVAASNSGKWKTVIQILAVSLLLLHWPVGFWGVEISLQWIGMNLLCLSIFFSYWSGLEYTYTILGSRVERAGQ